jgi:hypothetical protein
LANHELARRGTSSPPRFDQNSCYDSNGNQTTRIIGGQTVQLDYDTKNRLVSVTGVAMDNFTYNADEQQVKAIVKTASALYKAFGKTLYPCLPVMLTNQILPPAPR